MKETRNKGQETRTFYNLSFLRRQESFTLVMGSPLSSLDHEQFDYSELVEGLVAEWRE